MRNAGAQAPAFCMVAATHGRRGRMASPKRAEALSATMQMRMSSDLKANGFAATAEMAAERRDEGEWGNG